MPRGFYGMGILPVDNHLADVPLPHQLVKEIAVPQPEGGLVGKTAVGIDYVAEVAARQAKKAVYGDVAEVNALAALPF